MFLSHAESTRGNDITYHTLILAFHLKANGPIRLDKSNHQDLIGRNI